MPTEAYERFIASMQIGYEEWHDGTPYDLDALSAVTPVELDQIESLLIQKKNDDWRVSEALAKINSPAAVRALRDSTSGPNRAVRLRAGSHLKVLGLMDDLSELIIEGLRHGQLGDGLTEAERLATGLPCQAVIDELLRGALCSNDGRAVRFVGILFFLHGKADSNFDWGLRPFFLRFNTPNRMERQKAFDEMCQIIGVDGSNVRCS